MLNDCNNFKAEEWAANIVPYVLPLVANDRLIPLLLPSVPMRSRRMLTMLRSCATASSRWPAEI